MTTKTQKYVVTHKGMRIRDEDNKPQPVAIGAVVELTDDQYKSVRTKVRPATVLPSVDHAKTDTVDDLEARLKAAKVRDADAVKAAKVAKAPAAKVAKAPAAKVAKAPAAKVAKVPAAKVAKAPAVTAAPGKAPGTDA